LVLSSIKDKSANQENLEKCKYSSDFTLEKCNIHMVFYIGKMQIFEVLFLFISRKPSRSRLTNGLKMTLLLSGIMQMAKTMTSKQSRAMLLHGAS
jgi:hypothetical protein